MKVSKKPHSNQHLTKADLEESLDRQTKWVQESFDKQTIWVQESFDKQTKRVQESFDKQTKWVQKSFDKQTKWVQESFDRQTKSFSELINNLIVDVGIKFGEQDNKFNSIDTEIVGLKEDVGDLKIDFVNLNEKVDSLKDEIISSIKKELLDSNLQIIEEIRASREDQTTLSYRQRKHTDQLEDHDNRISILEENYSIVR